MTTDLRYAVGTPYLDQPIKIACPFHEDSTPSYAVYADGAYCFGCGAVESTEEFLARIEHSGELPEYRESKRSDKRSNSRRIDPLVSLWHSTLTDGPRKARRQWFRSRGFSDRHIQRFHFGHTGDHFVIPIPITDNEAALGTGYPGRFAGYKWRRDPEFLGTGEAKYRNSPGSRDLIVRPNPDGYPLIIVEGELDAYYLATFGCDSITSTSGAAHLRKVFAPDQLYRWNSDHKPVYLALDPDEAGLEAQRHLSALLPAARVCRWEGYGDISDYLLRVEADERFQTLKRILDYARPDTLEDGTPDSQQ